MALKFDITMAPPAVADIAAEREQIELNRIRLHKKNVRFVAVAVVILISIVCFQLLVAAPAAGDDSTDPTIVGIIALYTPYLIGAFFFTTLTLHHKVIEIPRKQFSDIIAGLQELTPEELADVARSEQAHAEIASYRQKVAAQGRPLVKAELDAIRRWLEKRKPPVDSRQAS